MAEVQTEMLTSLPGGGVERRAETEELLAAGPELIVITGMAGAGKSEAMHTFEDLGYFCIDNLPPSLLKHLIVLATGPGGDKRKLAVVCDLRSADLFDELESELKGLAERGVVYSVLFLEASDETLLRRFKATRRRHPLAEEGMTIVSGIQRERRALQGTRELASAIIDTTGVRPQELRAKIRSIFTKESAKLQLDVRVVSFGYKHGFPPEADIVIDVRFLPNPYWEPELRALTGADDPVRTYVMESDLTEEFLAKWFSLLDTMMKGYVDEGKANLTIAIGCTGGQHRSVVIAEKTAEYLREHGYKAVSAHRDVSLREISG